jgi:hypothetical protein
VTEELRAGIGGSRVELFDEKEVSGREKTSSSCSIGGSQCSCELLDRRLLRAPFESLDEDPPDPRFPLNRLCNFCPVGADGLFVEDFDVWITGAGDMDVTLPNVSLRLRPWPLLVVGAAWQRPLIWV